MLPVKMSTFYVWKLQQEQLQQQHNIKSNIYNNNNNNYKWTFAERGLRCDWAFAIIKSNYMSLAFCLAIGQLRKLDTMPGREASARRACDSTAMR